MDGLVSHAAKRRSCPFSTYHPLVAFIYLVCAILFAMAAMQPVYAALSLAGAFACACAVRGVRRALRVLAWAALLALIVAAANVIFVASGSSELFRIGLRAFYWESLVYGLSAGAMLASVILWFSSYAECMGSDNSLALFGNVLPTVTLMVSQVLRLVPQFVRRGHAIAAVQDAASSATSRNAREAVRSRLRVVSVLMGWGMEDGLIRSDAMRARGYACGIKRTTYRRFRIRHADVLVIGAVCVLVVLNGVIAARLLAGFSFYPVIAGVGAWWSYLPYAAFVALPPFLSLKEWSRWR